MKEKTEVQKCPICGSEEVVANTPRTTYGCGSSDYDQRTNTFRESDECVKIAGGIPYYPKCPTNPPG